jgi:hypothetical protein
VAARFFGGSKRSASVKDIHELLREKEMDCVRVQKEIDALRLVIPLMDGTVTEGESRPELETRKQPEPAPAETGETASGTGTEGPIFSSLKNESSFWKRRR